MELIIYPRLSHDSKKAMRRTLKPFGRKYQYIPQQRLIDRLMKELGITESEFYRQLEKEREWVSGFKQYYGS
jgi:hypothetical protein